MNNHTPDRDDLLQRNLDRLVSSAQPAEPMPADVKRRILAKLVNAGSTGAGAAGWRAWLRPAWARRMRSIPARRSALATVATLLIVVGTVALWPRSTARAMSWSDVAARFQAGGSVVAFSTTTQISDSGVRSCSGSKTFSRDPGLSRTEVYRTRAGCDLPMTAADFVTANLITATVISGEPGTDRQMLQLHYPDRRARVESLPPLESAEDGGVGALWRRLASVAESATRPLGEQVFGGVRLTGFEAPIDQLFAGWGKELTGGAVRVWVDPDTAVPARVDVDFQTVHGWTHRTAVFRLDWGAPVPDALFDFTIPDGWTVDRIGKPGASDTPSQSNAARSMSAVAQNFGSAGPERLNRRTEVRRYEVRPA